MRGTRHSEEDNRALKDEFVRNFKSVPSQTIRPPERDRAVA